MKKMNKLQGSIKTDISKDGLWKSDEADRYDPYAASVLSDRPIYETIEAILELNSQSKVLDFGSYRGTYTRQLANRAGLVVGVDSSEEAVKISKERSQDLSNVRFELVSELDPIPAQYGLFNAAIMTFVHPTIPTREILEYTIKKIADVVEDKGLILLLGLNPESFDKNLQFNFYGHSLPMGEHYRDELPFPNELRLANRASIKFFDYCWTPETIREILNKNGFSQVDITNIGINLKGKPGEVLKRSIKEVGESNHVEWRDEWGEKTGIPLYQLIVGHKIHKEA